MSNASELPTREDPPGTKPRPCGPPRMAGLARTAKGQKSTGEAMPRPCLATPRVAHNSEATPRPNLRLLDPAVLRRTTAGEAWSVRGRTQFRAVGVTARTKKCLKGITCVRFTPKNAGLCPELCHASPTKFSTAQTPCLAPTQEVRIRRNSGTATSPNHSTKDDSNPKRNEKPPEHAQLG